MAKPLKLAYDYDCYLFFHGLNPPVYIDTGGARVYAKSVTEKGIYIFDAKLPFHAKESPIWTRVQSSVFLSSQPISPARGQQAGRPRT